MLQKWEESWTSFCRVFIHANEDLQWQDDYVRLIPTTLVPAFIIISHSALFLVHQMFLIVFGATPEAKGTKEYWLLSWLHGQNTYQETIISITLWMLTQNELKHYKR